jgi:hypothetical protein
MNIGFDSSKVKSIKFYSEPDGKMYPVKDFPEEEKFLAGLKWQSKEQPLVEDFIKRKEKRASSTSEIKKEAIKTKKSKKKKK